MFSPSSPDAVLLDACVLVPIALCDTLLRLAECPNLYRPLWSPEILDEIRRTLTEAPFGLSLRKARYRIDCMTAAFPEALVTGFEHFIPKIGLPAQHDRHVVAAAVRGGAKAICTQNVRHFPRRNLRVHGLDVLSPDEFLVKVARRHRDVVIESLRRQASDRSVDLGTLLGILGKVVPRFAASVNRSAKSESLRTR